MRSVGCDSFVAARAAIARQAAGARIPHVAAVGDDDPFASLEDVEREVILMRLPPQIWQLRYRDRFGNLSSRLVTLLSVGIDGRGFLFNARCHVVKNTRTFRCYGVLEAIDGATGEVVTDFQSHLKAQLAESSEGRGTIAAAAVQDCLDELVIMTFVAASDGLIEECETDRLVAYVLDQACDPAVTEDDVRQLVRRLVPDEASLSAALDRMIDGNGDPVRLMRHLRAVMDANLFVDRGEVEFAAAIQELLQEAGRL